MDPLELIKEIKLISRALHLRKRELKKIQKNCEHRFPESEFEKGKKSRKVFPIMCSKCGYLKTVSEYAAMI